MTIVDFLRCRLDEDEAAAEGVHPGPWGAQPPEDQSTWDGGWEVVSDAYRTDQLGHPVVNVGDSDPTGIVTRRGGVVDEDHARYIARHDPAWVLREIAAKRAILDLRDALGDRRAVLSEYEMRTSHTEAGIESYDHVIQHMAAVYDDHPDYQQEWAP